MGSFISIPNWDELQHYKDRTPPWIKLHNELLESYEFECLPDASKAHLLCIWLLASRTNNKINPDPKWIGRKIGANSRVDIDILISNGFLQLNQSLHEAEQDASTALHSMEQSAITEERERRERGEQRRGDITEKIISEYHRILHELPAVIKITSQRKSKIKKLLKNDIQTIDAWTMYFEKVAASDFLMGRSEKWGADFEWLISSTNALKVCEGRYDNKKQKSMHEGWSPEEFK